MSNFDYDYDGVYGGRDRDYEPPDQFTLALFRGINKGLSDAQKNNANEQKSDATILREEMDETLMRVRELRDRLVHASGEVASARRKHQKVAALESINSVIDGLGELLPEVL